MSGYKTLFHVSLFVNDMKKSIAYYKRVGFDFLFDMTGKQDEEPWNTYMRIAPGQYLELQSPGDNNPHPHPGNAEYRPNQTAWHFAIETENMRDTIDRLIKNGIEVWLNPEKTARVYSIGDVFHAPDGCLVVWLVDPDGTPIEVMEQLGDTLQKTYDK
jgi:Lactoylglutathione lyase and related lyases